MKSRFVFGFILLILFFIGIFVGLPYVIQSLKSGSFVLPFPLPAGKQVFQKIATSPISNYFFSQPQTKISTPSPWQNAKKVSIGSVSRYGQGAISLRASYFSGGEKINITGWKIKSAQRGETLIGKGINLLQFESAPSDIWLVNGESAEVVAGVSPTAANFRINSCFGGLSEMYNLGYGFSCPAIESGDLIGLDSACQDLILRSVSCRAPSDDILNRQSSKCRIWFEKNVNYSACVVKHQNDRDFYRGWKIYTGNSNQIFDRLHDRIELRDQNGILIDSYEY